MEPIVNAMRKSVPALLGVGGLGMAAYSVSKYGDQAAPFYTGERCDTISQSHFYVRQMHAIKFVCSLIQRN